MYDKTYQLKWRVLLLRDYLVHDVIVCRLEIPFLIKDKGTSSLEILNRIRLKPLRFVLITGKCVNRLGNNFCLNSFQI